MNEQVNAYLEKYSNEIVALFSRLRSIVFDSASTTPQETLWAKLPSYYVEDRFIRLIPFKDHINIEAQAVTNHLDALSAYKVTPKGMLQVYLGQQIPVDTLKLIFAETLD